MKEISKNHPVLVTTSAGLDKQAKAVLKDLVIESIRPIWKDHIKSNYEKTVEFFEENAYLPKGAVSETAKTVVLGTILATASYFVA